jgi:peptide/nickel transport system permease protein
VQLALPAAEVSRAGRAALVWRNLWRSRSAKIGLSLLGLQLVLALFAPLAAPYSPTNIDPARSFQGPTWVHPFGTDQFGRDVLSRVMYGGRLALAMALAATVVAVAAGALAGLWLAYAGRWLDELGTRVLDALLAVPGILVLLVIVTALGSGPLVIVLAMAVHYAPGVARVARASALDIVPRDFVAAARARGEGALSIVVREIRPNVTDVLLVEFAMRVSWAVMLISALSFLGFGVNPPTPDWGLMIAENRSAMQLAPWVSIFPLLALSTLVISLNLTADALAKATGVDLVRGATA